MVQYSILFTQKHTKHRYLVLAVLTVLCVWVSVDLRAELLLVQQRTDALAEIDEVLQEAADGARSFGGYTAAKTEAQKTLVSAEQRLQQLMKAKRFVRLSLAQKRNSAEHIQATYGVHPADSAVMQSLIAKQQTEVQSVLEDHVRRRQSRAYTASLGQAVLQDWRGEPLGHQAARHLREEAVLQARLQALHVLKDSRDLPERLATMEQIHSEYLKATETLWDERQEAQQTIEFSEQKLEEIKQITENVELQVSRLQRKLADYDRRIRERAESELISLGLRNERSGQSRAEYIPDFAWPVTGRITAGFHEESYEEAFGVPHKAIDIAQRQGGVVLASADGVVYFVQNGGQYGYSYILIGHRGGFATLYGHMSQILVEPDQDIVAGQVIGLSGGTPGTHGAGPMTTGPHLHFEVIRYGEHLDPREVLP